MLLNSIRYRLILLYIIRYCLILLVIAQYYSILSLGSGLPLSFGVQFTIVQELVLDTVQSHFQEGRLIRLGLPVSSFPSDCLYYHYQHWFLEFMMPICSSGSPCRFYLNFEFNLDAEQKVVLSKAKSMGLLGYYYYQNIASFVKLSQQIPLEAFSEPVLHTNFVLENRSIEELCHVVTKLIDKHIEVTEAAFNALLIIRDKYKL